MRSRTCESSDQKSYDFRFSLRPKSTPIIPFIPVSSPFGMHNLSKLIHGGPNLVIIVIAAE